jgi:hypothetical protein
MAMPRTFDCPYSHVNSILVRVQEELRRESHAKCGGGSLGRLSKRVTKIVQILLVALPFQIFDVFLTINSLTMPFP